MTNSSLSGLLQEPHLSLELSGSGFRYLFFIYIGIKKPPPFKLERVHGKND